MRAVSASVLASVLALVVPTHQISASIIAQQEPPRAPGVRRSSWEGLAIVVNQTNSIDNVSLGQLRQIFSGEKRWWSSKRSVSLVSMPRGGAERQTMLRVACRISDLDLDRLFFFHSFRGEFPPLPKTLSTPRDVRAFVSTTPGAIGYLRASDVDPSVKVVRVDGLLPADDGYPLRLQLRPDVGDAETPARS